jgi:acyl carrier protein
VEASSLRQKVIQIVSQVMGVPEQEIGDESSINTVEVWDSLKHMNLVLALEEEFGVQFSDEKIVEMLSVAQIVEAVHELVE